MKFKTRKQLKQRIQELESKYMYEVTDNVNLRKQHEVLWRMHCKKYCAIYAQRGYIDTQLCCDYYQCPVCLAALFGKEPE